MHGELYLQPALPVCMHGALYLLATFTFQLDCEHCGCDDVVHAAASITHVHV